MLKIKCDDIYHGEKCQVQFMAEGKKYTVVGRLSRDRFALFLSHNLTLPKGYDDRLAYDHFRIPAYRHVTCIGVTDDTETVFETFLETIKLSPNIYEAMNAKLSLSTSTNGNQWALMGTPIGIAQHPANNSDLLGYAYVPAHLPSLPTSIESNLSYKQPMSLVHKHRALLRDNPEKAFVKFGITDEAGILTRDGFELVMQDYFEKNKQDFFDRVVAPMEEAEKEDKKRK